MFEFLAVFIPIALVVGFILCLRHLGKTPKPPPTKASPSNSVANVLENHYDQLLAKIVRSYRQPPSEEDLLLHQMPLIENEYIKLFYNCLMLDIVKLFDSKSITNSFSNNYWRAAKAKGYRCEDNIISETKLHFSSSDNLGSEEEELEQYVCAFCEKVYHMYKFKDGRFSEDIMIPMILSEAYLLHQNTRAAIRRTFMDISGYYLSSLSIADRNAFMQRHGTNDTPQNQPHSDKNATDTKEGVNEKNLLLKIGVSIGEVTPKSKAHSNLYTKLDFTIYIFFNLCISLEKVLQSSEVCQKFEERFHKAFISFTTEKLKLEESFVDKLYCDRMSTYNDIMISSNSDKDDALLFAIDQFIQRDIQNEYFSKTIMVCDISESINDTFSYNILYNAVMNDVEPLFNKIIAFYK